MIISDLTATLKSRLSKFVCLIANEDLVPYNTSYLRYNSQNKNWVSFPQENIRSIVSGVETQIPASAYTVTIADGYITFSTGRTSSEVIRADYSITPFTDTELLSILNSSLIQIRTLTYHRLISTDFNEDYSEAIIKRAFTIALRELQFPTTRYFSLSIGGKTIDKSTQVKQIDDLITSNEKDLMQDVNSLRYFNRTDILQ